MNLTQGCEEITQNFPQVTKAVAEVGGGVPLLETLFHLEKQEVRVNYLFKCVGDVLHSSDELGMQAN